MGRRSGKAHHDICDSEIAPAAWACSLDGAWDCVDCSVPGKRTTRGGGDCAGRERCAGRRDRARRSTRRDPSDQPLREDAGARSGGQGAAHTGGKARCRRGGGHQIRKQFAPAFEERFSSRRQGGQVRASARAGFGGCASTAGASTCSAGAGTTSDVRGARSACHPPTGAGQGHNASTCVLDRCAGRYASSPDHSCDACTSRASASSIGCSTGACGRSGRFCCAACACPGGADRADGGRPDGTRL